MAIQAETKTYSQEISNSPENQPLNIQVSIPTEADFAKSPEEAVEFISPDDVRLAVEHKQTRFALTHRHKPTLLIPIERGGHRLGKDLQEKTNFPRATLRMSYYQGDGRRPEPTAIFDQEHTLAKLQQQLIDFYLEISNNQAPIFTLVDTVGETFNTARTTAAFLLEQVQQLRQAGQIHNPNDPEFELEVLLIKTSGDIFPLALDFDKKVNGQTHNFSIPVLTEFGVDINYWVMGYSCDDDEHGRDLDNIMGRRSPFAPPLN